MESDDPNSISSDDPCYWAFHELRWNGNIESVIDLLDAADTAIHPLLQRELCALLSGTHPKLKVSISKRVRRGRPKVDYSPKELVKKRKSSRDAKRLTAKEAAKLLGGTISPRTIERADERVRNSREQLEKFVRAHTNRQK